MKMNFDESKRLEKFGEKTGYLFSYLMFTTLMFFILTILGSMPDGWTYFHIMGITLSVTILGTALKRALK